MGAKTLHFTIEGPWLTQHVRSLWADEGRPEHALRTLKDGLPDMPEEAVYSILTGRKKLEGDSTTGVHLVDDDATVSEHGNSLAMEDVLDHFREEMQSHKARLAQVVDTQERAKKRALGPPLSTRGLLAIDKEEEEEEAPLPPPPKPDFKITWMHGWLSPEGKFYRCEWMAHIWMARVLLVDMFGEKARREDEGRLEKMGWMKISQGNTFEPPGRRATTRQRNLVFDYFTEQDKPLPFWWDEE